MYALTKIYSSYIWVLRQVANEIFSRTAWDLLDIIQDVNELDQTDTLLSSELDLKGTTFGFDQDTQVNTFTTDNTITFIRALENTVRVDLDKKNKDLIAQLQSLHCIMDIHLNHILKFPYHHINMVLYNYHRL